MLIPTPKNTKTITDLREHALELLKQIKKEGPTYILHRSKPKAVMLSIDEYVALREIIENYLDAQRARELENHPQKRRKNT